MNIQSRSTQASAGVRKPRPSNGKDLTTGMNVHELRQELKGLSGEELKAHSVLEYRMEGGSKVYAGFILCSDERKPRCPNDPLPMNNGSLKTMVASLLKDYPEHAKKDLTFLGGGIAPPGFVQVTLEGSGLGLYFDKSSGRPMGQ
jgi:hypothetical protein